MSEPLQHYDLLIRLESEGDLKILLQGGVISTSVVLHFDISKRMNELIKANKFMPRFILVSRVCEEFKVSHMTVYRAMNTFGINK